MAPKSASIEELYRDEIKTRSREERERLVELVSTDLDAESKPQKKRSILELEGVGAYLWEGIDAQEYVNQIRAEWHERP